MLQLYKLPNFGDEITLRSIDWLENLPWRQENTVTTENDKCVISLFVKDFAPEEIKVKTSDGTVVVEAKHDEKKDQQGYISRQFKKTFHLPFGSRLDHVTSKLSSNGVLTITVPKQPVLEQDTVIPVSHEGGKIKSKL